MCVCACKMDTNEATKSSTSMSSSSPVGIESNSNITEQPQTKRQKIEKIKSNGKFTKASNSTSLSKTPPPDIINTREQSIDTISNNNKNSNHNHLCSSLSSSSSHSTSSEPSTTNNSPTSTPCSSRAASFAQLLNVQNLVNNILPQITLPETNQTQITPSVTASASSTINMQSSDEVDRVTILPDLLKITQTRHASKAFSSSTSAIINTSAGDDMREFEHSLTKQCLCGVSERTLRKPFQSHYSLDSNGEKRIANLSEWPTNKLVQFLSNLQLLFDIYLKQNSKGFICARIMDLCDALVRNDHKLIDEIIVLASYNNTYVQFLSGRVLAAFLVIAKQELNDDWLRKIVDILFSFEHLDELAVQKMHFSLDIIKRIVEWKDVELHPLEDEVSSTPPPPTTVAAATSSAAANSSSMLDVGIMPELNTFGYMHFPPQQPTLENNYFAVHFRSSTTTSSSSDEEVQRLHSIAPRVGDDNTVEDDDDDVENNATNSVVNRPLQEHLDMNDLYGFNESAEVISTRYTAHQNEASATSHTQQQTQSTSSHFSFLSNGCHMVSLTDSESFDTTHLKCITIQKLENKWPALVKNMSVLMSAAGSQLIHDHAEHCILNFLQLWENIISVKANLSIDETRPFYAQLDNFELLLNQNLSCTIYKQMLCLFNEALCYGSTLALQDMLPIETCQLAHQIVRHVKDFSILESLPRRQPENIVGLIGFQRPPVAYIPNTLEALPVTDQIAESDAIQMDKTILQKMVLLVLKSIAVTVKEIRSDSSDSSIDSTDYDAYHDMMLIERSIRDVISKLESFIKHTLEFHPECHFSKILIHLFDDQDDHLIESMVCTLDVTSGISFRNNAFPELVSMLNPVYTFLEFLKLTSNSSDLLLDLLVSHETCFLLYLLRFLKYIRMNWTMFVQSCHDFGMGASTLDEAMSVLIRLRLQITRLVSRQLYPYDISPVLRLLESCESLYEGNELS